MDRIKNEECLRVRLADAEDQQKALGNNKLAQLLNEAGSELEIAIGLLDESHYLGAEKFLSRHYSEVNAFTEDEAHVLRHALTGSNNGIPYRNYFYTEKNWAYVDAIQSLVLNGFMVPGKEIASEDGQYFHCTAAGAEAIGLALPLNPSERAPKAE